MHFQAQITTILKPIANNPTAASNLNSLIIAGLILSIPLFVALILSIIKFNFKPWVIRSLYAFTIGFFLIVGLYGEAPEAWATLSEAYDQQYQGWSLLAIKLVVMVAFALVSAVFAIIFKYTITKKFQPNFNWHNIHDQHDQHAAFHNHEHAHELLLQKSPQQKAVAIYLILSHRIIAGLFLGYIAYQFAHGSSEGLNIAFLIAFFLHLIPEETIVFYRLMQMGLSKLKALMYSLFMLFLLVPLIFVGANIGALLDLVPWLAAGLHIIIAVLFTFSALVEFFPEVIAEAKTHRAWLGVIIFLMLGLVAGFFALSFDGAQ